MPAISGPETAFCVFARDFTVSFVAKGHDSLEGELTGWFKLKDLQAGKQEACLCVSALSEGMIPSSR